MSQRFSILDPIIRRGLKKRKEKQQKELKKIMFRNKSVMLIGGDKKDKLEGKYYDALFVEKPKGVK
jgi:hypothetical protein